LVMPVAPTVVMVTAGSVPFTHKLGSDEGAEAVFTEMTFTVPVAVTIPQPPVKGMEKVNIPETVGVPLMVMVFAAQLAVKPAGSPVAVPIPVAPVVVKVIGVMA